MKELLIVVDYQKDFVDGALGFPGAETLDGPIAARMAQVRAGGGDVIFTMDTHGDDYAATVEGTKLPVPHCRKDTPGWQLYGQVGAALRPGDPVFEKETFPSLDLADWLREREYDAVELCGLVGWQLYGQVGAALRPGDPVFEKETFPSLDLADWLREREYDAVELCGLVSHICVLSNAVMVKAALPNAHITVSARRTASYDPDLHQKALDVLEGIHITVTDR